MDCSRVHKYIKMTYSKSPAWRLVLNKLGTLVSILKGACGQIGRMVAEFGCETNRSGTSILFPKISWQDSNG